MALKLKGKAKLLEDLGGDYFSEGLPNPRPAPAEVPHADKAVAVQADFQAVHDSSEHVRLRGRASQAVAGEDRGRSQSHQQRSQVEAAHVSSSSSGSSGVDSQTRVASNRVQQRVERTKQSNTQAYGRLLVREFEGELGDERATAGPSSQAQPRKIAGMHGTQRHSASVEKASASTHVSSTLDKERPGVQPDVVVPGFGVGALGFRPEPTHGLGVIERTPLPAKGSSRLTEQYTSGKEQYISELKEQYRLQPGVSTSMGQQTAVNDSHSSFVSATASATVTAGRKATYAAAMSATKAATASATAAAFVEPTASGGKGQIQAISNHVTADPATAATAMATGAAAETPSVSLTDISYTYKTQHSSSHNALMNGIEQSALSQGPRPQQQQQQQQQARPGPAKKVYKEPWDQLLCDSRRARSLDAVLLALKQNRSRGMPVSSRAAAEALGAMARLPAAAGRGQQTPSTVSASTATAAIAMDLLPPLEGGLHALQPQDLAPLLWSLSKLKLSPSAALLEGLLRELLANELEAVRVRGDSGLVMVAQGLCGLRSQLLPGPIGSLTLTLTSPGEVQGSGAAMQGKEQEEQQQQQQVEPIEKQLLQQVLADVVPRQQQQQQHQQGSTLVYSGLAVEQMHQQHAQQGLQEQQQDLGPVLEQQQEQQQPHAQEHLVSVLKQQQQQQQQQPHVQQQHLAPVLEQQQHQPHSKQHLVHAVEQQQQQRQQQQELSNLAQELASGVVELSRGRLGDMRVAVLAGLASSLARFGHHDKDFFEQIAQQAQLRLDTLPPYALSLMLRSLAAAAVYCPQLLSDSELVLVEGLSQLQPAVLPDLLYSYSHFKHPCPTLLPLVVRIATQAATSGALSSQRLGQLARNASCLGPVDDALSAVLQLHQGKQQGSQQH